MKSRAITKSLVCIFVIGSAFALYLEKQNRLTRVRMKIPELAKDLRALREENRRLEFSIEQFESPENLIQLLRKNEYCNLKHPVIDQILTIQHQKLFVEEREKTPVKAKPGPMLVIGAK